MRFSSMVVAAMVVIDLASKRKGGKCPVCVDPGEERYRPFCSRRCADLDLAKWLNGSYSVPVVELDEGDLEELEATIEDDGDLREKDY